MAGHSSFSQVLFPTFADRGHTSYYYHPLDLCDLFPLLNTHSLALTRYLLITSGNSESFHLLKQTERMGAVQPCFSTETHWPYLSLSFSLSLWNHSWISPVNIRDT